MYNKLVIHYTTTKLFFLNDKKMKSEKRQDYPKNIEST